MKKGEPVLREGKSLEETPTWALATVITVMVAFGFLVHHSLKRFGRWLEKTKRKSLLAALEKIEEELMLFGVLSLLMGHWIEFFAKICIKSSALDSRFFPCTKRSDRMKLQQMFVLSSKFRVRLNSSVARELEAAAHRRHEPHDYCPEGKDSFASYESLEQLHHFVFVLGVTHVAYTFIAIALAMIKIYSWRAWENHAKASAAQSLQESSPTVESSLKIRRQSTFIAHNVSHPWSQHGVLVWLLCFSRQFWSSINRADYMALRLGFITTHELPLTYDFHNYMVRSMEDEFCDIVGISVPFWIYCILCVFLDFHGTHIYFWLSFLPAILILLIGTKLHRVVVRLAVENMENSPSEGFHKFNLRDELFWFGRPRLLLRLIQLISFQNAFEMASFLWSLWEIKDPSCFMENRAFLVTRLTFGIISQCWCSYITFPLYVIVTQMGSKFKSGLVSENVRRSLSKWKRRVKEKQSASNSTRESPSASSLDSIGTELSKGHGICTSRYGLRTPSDQDSASPSRHLQESYAMQQSPSSFKGKKLKSPHSYYSEDDYSPNYDHVDAPNNDESFDAEHEIHHIEP
ncbi:MLO-like protein 4 [Hibiscus syriacus]|nr:MLO-like protein 4 [Hibiscus syriacus]